MILCPQCFRDNGDQERRCLHCGAAFGEITPEQNQATIRAFRRRQRLRGHMLTGALLCAGLPTLLGLPGSLLPGNLLQHLLFGIVFGVPLGYLVSRYARSIMGGALIGCAVGIGYCLVLTLLITHQWAPAAIAAGIATGLLPGAIMGWHVAMD